MTDKRPNPRPAGRAVTASGLCAAGVALLLIAAAVSGRGQEKTSADTPAGRSGSRWTIVSHDRTNFPLVGRHRTLSCRECHINGVFEGTPAACEVCHWERRQDDRYRLRLGFECALCHSPQSWKKIDPLGWSHDAVTGYRLEGAHQFLDCEDCHGARGFTALPTDCYSCHAEVYRQTDDPDHAAAGFPTDCSACHSTRSWEGATFAHTGFPLQGRHRTAACADCHAGGVYAGTSTACASCHLADYNSTTDPNHKAQGFSLECQDCHGTSASGWEGADDMAAALSLGVSALNHEFPVAAGRHAGLACSDCHTSSSYRRFDCLDCHSHAREDMAIDHRSVLGYAFSSPACYACHPRGTR